MKKVFLTLALAAFAFAANAQFVVGGNLGYSTDGSNVTTETKTATGTDVTETTDPSSSFFFIMPKIGYQINDKMQAGLIFGYSTDTYTRYSGFSPNEVIPTNTNWEGTRTTNSSTITIKPYFRYNVMELGDFKLFVEASVPFITSPVTKWKEHETYTDNLTNTAHDLTAEGDNKTKTTTIGFEIVPGLSYNLSDNISLDIYINAIKLAYTSSTETYENPDAPVGLDLKRTTKSNDFNFGCRTLPAAVSVGFNYHF